MVIRPVVPGPHRPRPAAVKKVLGNALGDAPARRAAREAARESLDNFPSRRAHDRLLTAAAVAATSDNVPAPLPVPNVPASTRFGAQYDSPELRAHVERENRRTLNQMAIYCGMSVPYPELGTNPPGTIIPDPFMSFAASVACPGTSSGVPAALSGVPAASRVTNPGADSAVGLRDRTGIHQNPPRTEAERSARSTSAAVKTAVKSKSSRKHENYRQQTPTGNSAKPSAVASGSPQLTKKRKAVDDGSPAASAPVAKKPKSVSVDPADNALPDGIVSFGTRLRSYYDLLQSVGEVNGNLSSDL